MGGVGSLPLVAQLPPSSPPYYDTHTVSSIACLQLLLPPHSWLPFLPCHCPLHSTCSTYRLLHNTATALLLAAAFACNSHLYLTTSPCTTPPPSPTTSRTFINSPVGAATFFAAALALASSVRQYRVSCAVDIIDLCKRTDVQRRRSGRGSGGGEHWATSSRCSNAWFEHRMTYGVQQRAVQTGMSRNYVTLRQADGKTGWKVDTPAPGIYLAPSLSSLTGIPGSRRVLKHAGNATPASLRARRRRVAQHALRRMAWRDSHGGAITQTCHCCHSSIMGICWVSCLCDTGTCCTGPRWQKVNGHMRQRYLITPRHKQIHHTGVELPPSASP